MERATMPTITQRIASAFVVFCGRYGDVTKMAHQPEQSRQSLYREGSLVVDAVDGTAAQSQIDELERRLAVLRQKLRLDRPGRVAGCRDLRFPRCVSQRGPLSVQAPGQVPKAWAWSARSEAGRPLAGR